MEQLDAVVIGAGVVGLAIARNLAQAGREVLVLEKNTRFGEETSARNSEVIHAGLYYPQGSLKAQTCVRGNRLLYDYCRERAIPHQACGKLVVATDVNQLSQLQALQQQATNNACVPLTWLDKAELQTIEPELRAEAALLSPSTGIVDSHSLMQALLADLEAAGGQLVTANPVTGGQINPQQRVLQLDGYDVQAALVVNAAGLHAPALARQLHGAADWIPVPAFARGNYFSLSGKNPFQHLIYPLPEQAGLGIHLTLDLQGRARFGPDVQWLDIPDASVIDYRVDVSRKEAFAEAIRAYWPVLDSNALQPDYTGVRPKITAPGVEAADFLLADARLHGCDGVMHLFGIESPGLTACLALAEVVSARLLNTGA
ncbi:NAD(P)/FAD-dependent oxidoreductase [Marinospirillum alkaliphilum]|uniref:L-2-hydroxyglutarate oxidase LhgO n=1 Tax=Marinospirillum alkaliphilum DSM 21637 TaxID=1122209 RepID=A0A1K1ZWW6_9GAMM|nr:NAD(P)/FAD-dependent oxidoreductase [Marinospirillum alkaliphilum]SFX78607.1 L-2-hydroxyglutarate oxidase LhgO [Marinospirillum alkaliphilum DSM 21637]